MKILRWLIASLVAAFPLPAFALGDLMVTPTRVVLEGRQHSMAINIVNSGSEPATYRITVINQRMTEDGRFEELKAPGPNDRTAETLIRYTPRQVILPPGGSQVVRVQVTRRQDLPDGEYRSHLLFRSIPPVQTSEAGTGSREVSVKLIPVYGVSIPLIVRRGTTGAKVTLADLRLEKRVLSLRINRSGNRSVFGTLSVEYVSRTGQKKSVCLMNGLSVYFPNASRLLSVPLSEELKGGLLKATFQEPVESGEPIRAETQLEL